MLSLDNIHHIVEENQRRVAQASKIYNPLTGEGSLIPRFEVANPIGSGSWFLPNQLLNNKFIATYLEKGSIVKTLERLNLPVNKKSIHQAVEGMMRLRLLEDFEFWSIICNTIKNKEAKYERLRLNNAQQKLNLIAEELRLSKSPLRINLLKCRQYGGTTYIRSRFNWLQTARGNMVNCAIAADLQDQAKHAIGMFNVFASHYPKEFGVISTGSYERSQSVMEIKQTGGLLAVGSMQNPEALSGKTFQLLHCTEIGKWKKTDKLQPEEFMVNLSSMVPMSEDSEIWRESTAKGLNFFYTEWTKAEEGISGYENVFVGTWEIEMYQMPIVSTDNILQDYTHFISEYVEKLSDEYRNYANHLWSLGATLENIKWYFEYMRLNSYDWYKMMEEYPNTPDEAFQTSGQRCFKKQYTQQLRIGNDSTIGGVREPVFIGDIYADEVKREGAFDNLRLVADDIRTHSDNAYNKLMVWEMPPEKLEVTNRFLITVDIGGIWIGDRNERCSDFSVIGIFDRYWTTYGLPLRCVATWRGHIEVDLLAWKAAQLAKLWHNAMLGVERNYQKILDSENNHIQTILQELKEYYDNIYSDTPPDQIKSGVPAKYGLWTSRGSKELMVDNLIAMLRDGMYLERYKRAVDEMDWYECKEGGGYGAMPGKKDDVVITRLMAGIIHERMEPCKPIIKSSHALDTPVGVGRGTAASV